MSEFVLFFCGFLSIWHQSRDLIYDQNISTLTSPVHWQLTSPLCCVFNLFAPSTPPPALFQREMDRLWKSLQAQWLSQLPLSCSHDKQDIAMATAFERIWVNQADRADGQTLSHTGRRDVDIDNL